jgi:hypothetical protein
MMVISALITGFMKHESAFYVFRAVTGLGGALVTASNFGMPPLILKPRGEAYPRGCLGQCPQVCWQK